MTGSELNRVIQYVTAATSYGKETVAKTQNNLVAFAIAFVIAVALPGAAMAGPSFQGLGDLPGGEFASRAFDISADALIVVGDSHSTLGITEAFRWTNDGGMIGLGNMPGGISSTAFDVSVDGSVVVGRGTSASGDQAFRWTNDGGIYGAHAQP